MHGRSTAVFASLLAAAALAPASAGAAQIDLGGQPQLRLIDSRHATLTFAADRLPRTDDGVFDVRIGFRGGQRVSSPRATGRHGDDVVYSARVSSRNRLRVDAKYTVTFEFADQEPIVRKVKLHPRRS